MISLLSLLLVGVVFALIYLFLVWNYNNWSKRGVRGPKPKLFVGTYPNILTQKKHFAEDVNDIYLKYKDRENYVGVYLMRTPQLMVLDPQYVHEIFVTAFKHFHDNETSKLVDKNKDPLICNNPFLLTGKDWKDQRALATPGLTSSRIKVAYSVMQKVCRNLCAYIDQESKIVGADGLNGKDVSLRFTAENVCDSVLGIQARSFTSNPVPVGDNVRKFADNNTIFLIYSLMTGILPSITKIFKAKFVPLDTEIFFMDLIKNAFKIRSESKVERQDIMNHLLTMCAKKQLNENEMVSHSMTFLIDGLETTAGAIAHCLLLLSQNPDSQEKLFNEILENVDENNEISFEKLNDMPYLDACLHETLRLFPPAVFSTKTCTEPFDFINKNGDKLHFNVGETVLIPIYSFHHDGAYYEEPEQFKPERFLPENGGIKKYKDMGVYLGFGDGPRACLGMRFALVQSKAAISSIIRQFNVKANERTEKVYKLDPQKFVASQIGGIWLNFEKRT